MAEIKATYHVQLFSGVSHGFATRGDPNVENSRAYPSQPSNLFSFVKKIVYPQAGPRKNRREVLLTGSRDSRRLPERKAV